MRCGPLQSRARISAPSFATPSSIFAGGTVTNDRRSVLCSASFAKNGPPGTNATCCSIEFVEQFHRVDVLRQRHPHEHAAFRPVPFDARRHVMFERREHRRALVAIQRADGRHVLVEKTVLDHFVHDALREARRVQIGCLLGLHELEVQFLGRDDVAHAQPRRQHLRERAEMHDVIGRHRQHGRQRGAGVVERAVRIVLDDRERGRLREFREGAAALERQAASGRVLEVRLRVQQARALDQLRRRGARGSGRARRSAPARSAARTSKTTAARRDRSAFRPARGSPGRSAPCRAGRAPAASRS